MDLPGAAHLVLADGVVHLEPEPAVFEAMPDGWARKQRTRFLDEDGTIKPRLSVVRRPFVHLGALPGRDEELDRIPAWLDTVLAVRPVGHVQMARPYAHWHLLRRARRRAAQRRRPAEPGSFLRTRVLVALEFLTWLDEHGLDLGGLRQDGLDRWLDAGNTRTYAIRYFLSWTTGRGLTGKLTVPSIPRQQPSQLMDEDGHWQLLKRCLTDSTMALDTRAAGALIPLFGLHASHVRHLTATQLAHRWQQLPHRRPAPNPAAAPARQAPPPAGRSTPHPSRPHPHQPRRATALPRSGPRPPHLSDRPQLKTPAPRIDTRPARNAALVALAGDLPAPVLASILGSPPQHRSSLGRVRQDLLGRLPRRPRPRHAEASRQCPGRSPPSPSSRNTHDNCH